MFMYVAQDYLGIYWKKMSSMLRHGLLQAELL